jgi:hypothetical protein
MPFRYLRDAHLAIDSEILEPADAATVKETCLAALTSEAEIRDAVCAQAALLNAQDEALSDGRRSRGWAAAARTGTGDRCNAARARQRATSGRVYPSPGLPGGRTIGMLPQAAEKAGFWRTRYGPARCGASSG